MTALASYTVLIKLRNLHKVMLKSTVDQITQRRRGTGLIAHDPTLSAGGYTLIAPQTGGGKVYLIDIYGSVVH